MKKKMLMLRTCDAKMQSYDDFQWPKKGKVTCSDWSPEPVCGGGLHGLPGGIGDGSLLSWSEEANWIIFEVDDYVMIGLDKAKAREGDVVFVGTQKGAVQYLVENGYSGPIVGLIVESGDRGTSESGDRGTSKSGDRGTSKSGYRGTSKSGNWGTSKSGDRGTSKSGYGGTSESGNWGTSESGDRGTSKSGYGGTSESGNWGMISIFWWDDKKGRKRLTVGYVGENGIKPNVAYLVRDGKLEEAKERN